MYEELFSFNDLERYRGLFKEGVIFFFDIQGVLIQNNNYHEALSSKKYEEKLKQICIKHNESYIKISRFGRFFRSKLTEDCLPNVLYKLKKCGVEICLLTFARYSIDREKTLKNHKILDYFNKQIWAGGIDKGLLMAEFLKAKCNENNNKIFKVFFVDDKEEHLQSVKKELEGTEYDLHLFLYKKYSVQPVKEEDFEKFWTSVIQVHKKKNKKNKIKRSNKTNKKHNSFTKE